MTPSTDQARPVADWVLVRPVPEHDGELASGLFVPHSPTGLLLGFQIRGIVLAVGPGLTHPKLGTLGWTKNQQTGAWARIDVFPGQKVVFPAGYGPEVDFEEGPHWFVKAYALLAELPHDGKLPERGVSVQRVAPMDRGPELVGTGYEVAGEGADE